MTERPVRHRAWADHANGDLGSAPMSALDVQALETNFENWRKERVPHLSIGEAFERYAIEHVLKDADLSV